jgi:predicted Zn-dependent protease
MMLAGVGGFYLWSARDAAKRREALDAAARGDLAAAEPGLLRAYSRNPSDPEVVEALARGYLKADSLRAEGFLSRWVELRPGQAEPLRARMEFYRKRRDGNALEDARRLLELDPTNIQLRRSVMAQAFSYGSFEEAEILCRDCLQAQPSDPFLRTMLAEIRRARGDATGAAAILDELISASPEYSGPLLARATLHQEAGEWAKSEPLLRTVYDRDQRQRRAAGYLLSLALGRTGKSEESRKVLSEVRRLQDVEVFGDAIKNQPNNLELQTRLGATLLTDGHTQDGLELLNAVLTRDPWFRPAHQALATYYEKQGDAARAAEHRRLAGPGDGT